MRTDFNAQIAWTPFENFEHHALMDDHPKSPRSDIPAKLRALRERAGLSVRELADALGWPHSTYSTYEGRYKKPYLPPDKARQIADVLAARGIPAEEIFALAGMGNLADKPAPVQSSGAEPSSVDLNRAVPIPAVSMMPKDVPVLGVAVGGSNADFEFNGQIVDYVRRPPGLIGVRDAFGVYVIGTSMWPRYEEGDLVYVHPGRPARPGDDVIIEAYANGDDDRSGNCYIKRLLRTTPTKYVCQQYNPMREDLEYHKDKVKKVHRIMTQAELMSA